MNASARRRVKVGFRNHLTFEVFKKEALWLVDDLFEFVESDAPEVLIFGPYGPAVPAGGYVRVGYYCENMTPDMNGCEWAFGMPYEDEIRNPRYKRIEWHALTPQGLAVPPAFGGDPFEREFANFVYAQRHPHREALYRAVAAYKPVAAPGKSMNNMPSLDSTHTAGDMWERKRSFLARYKFTVAIENYSQRGYNTEKLTDPLLAGSVPIYWGNPEVARHFNPGCFINAHDYLPYRLAPLIPLLDALARDPYAPGDTLWRRAGRRFRREMRRLKMSVAYGSDFRRLLERVRQVDGNRDAYMTMLRAPRLADGQQDSVAGLRARWAEIVSSAAAPR